MTREKIEYAIKVMQAYLEGATIESRHNPVLFNYPDETLDKYYGIDRNPTFDWERKEYRVKTKPKKNPKKQSKYRPFKDAEECLQEISKHTNGVFLKLVSCNYPKYDIIGTIDDDGIYCIDNSCSFKEALEKFSFVDDVPFGIKK